MTNIILWNLTKHKFKENDYKKYNEDKTISCTCINCGLSAKKMPISGNYKIFGKNGGCDKGKDNE